VNNQRKDEIVLAVTGLNLDSKTPTMDVVPLVPLPHCALKAKVSATYIQRHILKGREFYDEGMHDIQFIESENKIDNVRIVGADDVAPFVWNIQIVPPNGEPDNNWDKGQRHALTAVTAGGLIRRIVLSDYGRAVKMAHWVRTHPKDKLASTPTGSPPEEAGKYSFNYGADQFLKDPIGYGLAVIKQTGDECQDQTFGPVIEAEMASK
jgi:hypothetical protein